MRPLALSRLAVEQGVVDPLLAGEVDLHQLRSSAPRASSRSCGLWSRRRCGRRRRRRRRSRSAIRSGASAAVMSSVERVAAERVGDRAQVGLRLGHVEVDTAQVESPQQTRSHADPWIAAASWFAACVPTALISVIVLSAAYVRLSFGRWPVVYHDSIDGRFGEAVVTMTALSLVALLPSILVLPIVAVGRALSGIRPVFGRWAVWFTMDGWSRFS